MIGCAVSSDLARHEREMDRADAMDSFANRIHKEDAAKLAKRLMRCKGWIAEEIGEGGDTLADLALAVSYAADGDDIAAGAMLREAFGQSAKEKAGELLEEAINDYFDRCERQRPRRGWSYDDEPPSPPDAESVDLSEYE
jgi:hypothetical protein